MINKERASWDLGTGSHGVLGEVIGTVPVRGSIRENCMGEMEKGGKGGWGLELSRENHKSGVEEQNLITDVENSIFDFSVVELLRPFFID
nr:hypothetical protein [Tanacetum cinerariifolium]